MNNLRSVPMDEAQKYDCSIVTGQAEILLAHIGSLIPVGRERSLAITKLEECVMWANKAISQGGSTDEKG